MTNLEISNIIEQDKLFHKEINGKYDVRSSEIESLFDRISISLGLKINTSVCSIDLDGVEVFAVG